MQSTLYAGAACAAVAICLSSTEARAQDEACPAAETAQAASLVLQDEERALDCAQRSTGMDAVSAAQRPTLLAWACTAAVTAG